MACAVNSLTRASESARAAMRASRHPRMSSFGLVGSDPTSRGDVQEQRDIPSDSEVRIGKPPIQRGKRRRSELPELIVDGAPLLFRRIGNSSRRRDARQRRWKLSKFCDQFRRRQNPRLSGLRVVGRRRGEEDGQNRCHDSVCGRRGIHQHLERPNPTRSESRPLMRACANRFPPWLQI